VGANGWPEPAAAPLRAAFREARALDGALIPVGRPRLAAGDLALHTRFT
jgi:hypothetical protein